MTLHVYNPSHDEALASNLVHYCPSAAARRTAEAFWDVARHWAAPDDVILRLPADGSLHGATMWQVGTGTEMPAARLDWSAVTVIEPWGWDRHIVGILQRLGAPERLLPTSAELDWIRELSSRRTAVEVVERLFAPGLPADLPAGIVRAESRWCTTPEVVGEAVAAFGGVAVFKQPWSCSGRGVWRNDAHAADSRVAKTLREQGAVEVEPLYTRIADCAMEFWSDGAGNVRYEGLSLFATHEGGGYAGNVIAPQAELIARLGVSPSLLADLSVRLAAVLSGILSAGCGYRGPLGVDMMLTPDGLHPCIEVNLRNTMGRVALFQAQGSAQSD